MPRTIILLVLNASFFSLALVSCGTQDYEEDSKPSAGPKAVASLNWREKALAKKHEPAEVTSGKFEDLSQADLFKTIPQSDRCPQNTVCIRSIYFGEDQLGHLVREHPEIFQIHAIGKSPSYQFILNAPLRIESDLIEIREGLNLQSCGPDLTISASEISGGGEILTSAEACAKKDPHAGNLFLAAPTVHEVQLRANGRDGDTGSDGSSNLNVPTAMNGNPNSLSIEIEAQLEPIRLCIDVIGCMRNQINVKTEFDNKGSGWDRWGELMDLANKEAEKNLGYLELLGLPKGELIKLAADGEASLPKDLGSVATLLGVGGCFLVSDSAHVNETGIVKKFLPKLKGIEGLHGKDALQSAHGTDGQSGGNAGIVEVIALDLKIPKVEAIPGKAGHAGKSLAQEAGRGVVPAVTSKEYSYFFEGHVSCEDMADDKGNVRVYDRSPIKTEVKKTFTIGQDYSALSQGVVNILGAELKQEDGSFKGKDGKALAHHETLDGKTGESHEPSLLQMSVKDLLISKLKEKCPNCEIPKALE